MRRQFHSHPRYTIPSSKVLVSFHRVASTYKLLSIEKANYAMMISEKSGKALYTSSPLKHKDHFSKLFPLEARFTLSSVEESFNDSLLLSFNDPSSGSSGQVYSIPFSQNAEQEVQLTEWLTVALSTSALPGTAIQSVQSMRSLGSSASLETTASVREKKKGLFNFRKKK